MSTFLKQAIQTSKLGGSMKSTLHILGCASNLRAIKKHSPVFIRLLNLSASASPKVCIVGSGPASFYAAQHIIKSLPNAQVDIYERLPVPFGLVRFGVAPDHPEVKNVINTFTKTAKSPQCRFIGNVTLGQDISLQELKEAYHAVLLAYGAEEDKQLGIKGEILNNVLSAREFVGWYNGLPQDRQLKVDLSSEQAVVLGHGNVALDVARILLTPIDHLKSTDITEHALEALSHSKIRHVHVVGRRGPLQVAFTIKEFREMTKLTKCITVCNPQDFQSIQQLIPNLERPRRRLTELLCKAASSTPPITFQEFTKGDSKFFHLMCFRSPKAFIPAPDEPGKVGGVRFSVNQLDEQQRAVPTHAIEEIPCGLVLRSIGYRSIQADKDLPFDSNKGLVPNNGGVVQPGLYVAGWLATGPVGVILSTMTQAFGVGRAIVEDLKSGLLRTQDEKLGYEAIAPLLEKRGVPTVSWSDWEHIDAVEQERGNKVGKPREKIVDVQEMLNISVGCGGS